MKLGNRQKIMEEAILTLLHKLLSAFECNLIIIADFLA